MAGLKKKKKEKSSSPNIALVVFLVLFVLTSIGLFVWGYYGYAGQETLRTERKKALDSAKIEKTTGQFWQMVAGDLKTAIFGADAVAGDEKTELDANRVTFNQADFGPFKNEKSKDAVRKTMEELRQKLGTAGNNVDYKDNLKAELEAASAKIKDIEGKVAAEVEKHTKTKELLAQLQKDQEKVYQALKDKITKDALAQQQKTEQKSEEFTKLSQAVLDLNNKIREDGEKFNEKLDDYDKIIKANERKIKILEAEKRENAGLAGAGGGPAVGSTRGGDFFPLLLDISPGKPLWDQPVGKVVRVDLDLRQVTINLGEKHGVKPELTFNVFGANAVGRAEKQLKGTIEVIKVIDSNSSLCRITSLYDADGSEITMNLKTRGQTLRETEAPMKEGDLLFNLFWGTRVAVTGYVSITGESVDNPAQQFSQMDAFMALCRRNGMIVDAYVDMRTGKIEGKITGRTRYLIRGEELSRPGAKNAPPAKKDDDMDKKDDDQPAKDAGLGDRIDQVNRSSKQLRDDARDKGLLLISAENFANVIGYRKFRSANSVELSGFRPKLPVAGEPQIARPAAQPAAQAEPPMDKKDDAPKEKEMEKKKDADN